MSLGRVDGNDIVVADLRVSRQHAQVERAADGSYEIVDLDSNNGTFVNGQAIERSPLREGDLVSVGNTLFRFTGTELQLVEDANQTWLLAEHLGVTVGGGKVLLNDVSLALPPATFLAVLGPSGSGKSTFLTALSGIRQATSGSVHFGGRDVYTDYEDLRHRMGFVPQEEVLHPQLTVRQVLDYAAKLRFAADVDADERNARIDEVVEELGLAERQDLRIDRLSGGQRERASTAMELLTRPALLFLDEPTSGLDPGNERQVMSLLRELTKAGRTIVVVTHKLDSLELCDRVLFLATGGRLAYYGPPQELLAYFDRHGWGDNYPEVFRSLDAEPDRDWAAAFSADPLCEQYVNQPLLEAREERSHGPVHIRPTRLRGWWWQFGVLSSRYIACIRNDPRTTRLMAAQAPIFAVLFLLLMRKDKFTTGSGSEALALIWLLVLSATWLGTSNSIREIVKELPIYRRERAVGLSPSAYAASKIAVLGVITIAQCALVAFLVLIPQKLPSVDESELFGDRERLTAIAVEAQIDPDLLLEAFPSLDGRDGAALSDPRLELVIGVVLAGLAAMALGLFTSAMVKSQDRALVLLPLILVTQVVLSLPFLPSESQSLEVAGVASSARWGMATNASTVSLNQLRVKDLVGFQVLARLFGSVGDESTVDAQAEKEFVERTLAESAEKEPRWRHDPGIWWGNVAVLLGMIAALLAGTIWAVRRERAP
ncbi:MAG: ATP-binding cassette domain-containing protein [Acidimicrobiales bacterium]